MITRFCAVVTVMTAGLLVLPWCSNPFFRHTFVDTLLFVLGIRKIHVHGKIHPDTRVFAFNHPSRLDMLVMHHVIPGTSGLIKDTLHARILLRKHTCVFVNGRNTNTRQRLLDTLQKHPSLKLSIALHNLLTKRHIRGGWSKYDRISGARSIAFSLDEQVQPVVIVYDNPPAFDTFELLTTKLVHPGHTISVYILPPMRIKNNETPRQFTDRAVRIMNRVLDKAWNTRVLPPSDEDLQAWFRRNMILTCLMFGSIAAHAFVRRAWRHTFLLGVLVLAGLIHYSQLSRHPLLATVLYSFSMLAVVASLLALLGTSKCKYKRLYLLASICMLLSIGVLYNKKNYQNVATFYNLQHWMKLLLIIWQHVILFATS